ncbi:MAG: hypothetical protein HQK95_06515 [Nitrospirae bacterium]|nr:hypothetical protein [Nitrospirota bacterium]
MRIKIIILLKKIFRKLIYIVIIYLVLLKACEDDIISDYINRGWQTIYFKGTGHSGEVRLDADYDGRNLIKLDNFTKDAYDIMIFTEAHRDYWLDAYYWASFLYETFSTYCTEVDESKTAFPYSLMSPSWWPDELEKPFFEPFRQPNRSNYKFYRCRALNASYRDSFFEYFAIDDKSKKGYYWKTIRKDEDMDNETIKRYY